MKNLKNKKGISLIVLILTIIVMIILAAAIILSLNNSGIIDKATKAKTDSDNASLKEYASILKSEWELMSEAERGDYSSSIEYVNAKFNEKGYTNKTYSADGEIYSDLPDMAKEVILNGIKIGDEVKYITEETVVSEPVTPLESETGTADNTAIEVQKNLKWIYIGVSEKGELLITPDVSNGVLANSDVTLCGATGCLKGPGELDRVCSKLYTVEGKGTASSMDIDDVIRILGYTGEKGSYRDSQYNYESTTEAKTIGDIEKNIVGKTISRRGTIGTIDGKEKLMEDYNSDYYYINKNDDVREMKNSKYVNLIYPNEGEYWLASSCSFVDFCWDVGVFAVRLVEDVRVHGRYLFQSDSMVRTFTASLRPVVSLTSKIQLVGGVWEFVS